MPERMAVAVYSDLQTYDVLQICRANGKGWQDFATLRTIADFNRAIELIRGRSWDGAPVMFRVMRRDTIVAEETLIPLP